MAPLYSPVLTPATTNLAMILGRSPIIVHGFGVWGHTAVRACEQLTKLGTRCVSLLGSYTTYLDESLSQWRGLVLEDGLRIRAKFAFEYMWNRAMIQRYERYAYRNADRILVNYRSVQKMINNRFGTDLQCDIISYTVEKEFELPRQEPSILSVAREGPPVIVSIARHLPRKGIDVLLQALRIAKQRGLSFSAHLVGGGPLLEAHCRLLESSQLGDFVTIHGIVPNIDEYLHQADLFVLPSREEQSGSLALLEAMRAGVACIASGCDGILEDVVHKSDAWLTTPGDHDSLAEGIIVLIKNRSLRERLAHAGRRTFEQRFSGHEFSNVLDSVYHDALKNVIELRSDRIFVPP
jgi:glycosyltransferase involved in cell wall biosynthesis